MNLNQAALLILLAAWFSMPLRADTKQQETVTVRVWALPSAKEVAPNRVAEYRVAQRFQELHPFIKLESPTHLQIAGGGGDAALLMQIAGGTAPDVFELVFREIDTFVQQGFLYPLDEYVAQLAPDELAERVPAKIKPVIFQRRADGTFHYWAFPSKLSPSVMYYRKDLFEDAGLDPDKPPANWAELQADITACADPSKGRYGMALGIGERSGFTIIPFLNGAGAQVVTQASDGTWTATFDSPAAVSAFSFVDTLIKTNVTKNGKTGPIIYRAADIAQMIQAGKVAIYFGGSDFPLTPPDVTGVAPIPVGPAGVAGTQFNARMLGIFAGVKDKRVRDAAWEYIRFVDSDEAHRIYTQTMVELGAGNFINPDWLEKYGYPQIARQAPAGLASTLKDAVDNGIPDPYGKNCQMIYQFMSRPLDQMFNRNFAGLTPEQKDAAIQALLDKAVAETNERMLDIVPPAERWKRNTVAWVVAAAVGIIFATLATLMLRGMMRNWTTHAGTGTKGKWLPVAFVLPAVLLIAVWHYYPLMRGSLMAFQDYRIMGGSSWVGISNFSDVLFDARFWLSLENALYFCALWMLLGFVPPVFLAILLQEIPVGKIAFRILFYIPAVVSGVVILFMWRGIYDPSPDGILNRAIGFIGLHPQTWLQDPNLAMVCIVFPLAWAHLGPGSIIYLAALKGIPEELYEAADIDGAGFFNKLRYIVLPFLRPLLIINAVGATIFGFKSTDAVLAMTGGGPNLATQVVGYEIWQRTFLFLKFGEGTAMAWILGLILMCFTVIQMRVLARVEFRTAK